LIKLGRLRLQRVPQVERALVSHGFRKAAPATRQTPHLDETVLAGRDQIGVVKLRKHCSLPRQQVA
jgi:hypothetical protein